MDGQSSSFQGKILMSATHIARHRVLAKRTCALVMVTALFAVANGQVASADAVYKANPNRMHPSPIHIRACGSITQTRTIRSCREPSAFERTALPAGSTTSWRCRWTRCLSRPYQFATLDES